MADTKGVMKSPVVLPASVVRGLQWPGQVPGPGQTQRAVGVSLAVRRAWGDFPACLITRPGSQSASGFVPGAGVVFEAAPRLVDLLLGAAPRFGSPLADGKKPANNFYLLAWMHRGWREVVWREALGSAAQLEEQSAKAAATSCQRSTPDPRAWGDATARVAWMRTVEPPSDTVQDFVAQTRTLLEKDADVHGWRAAVSDWADAEQADGRDVRWPVSEFLQARGSARPESGELTVLRRLLQCQPWEACAREYDARMARARAAGEALPLHPIYDTGPIDLSRTARVLAAEAKRTAKRQVALDATLDIPAIDRQLWSYGAGALRGERPPAGEADTEFASNPHWCRFYDPAWGCEILTDLDGIVPGQWRGDTFTPAIDGILVLLCGAGMWFSTPLSMIAAGNELRHPKDADGRRIGKRLGVLALAHPFHRGGRTDPAMYRMTAYRDWLLEQLTPLKQLGLPLVFVGRSTGANMGFELALADDTLFSAAIFMSPQRPAWSATVLENILRMTREGIYEIHPDGLLWALHYDWPNVDPVRWRYDAARWASPADWLEAMLQAEIRGHVQRPQWTFPRHFETPMAGGLRTRGLILASGQDAEYPPGAAQQWAPFAAHTGFGHFVNAAAVHNHFSLENSHEVRALSVAQMHAVVAGVVG